MIFHIDAKDPITKNQRNSNIKSDSNDVIVMCNVGVFTTCICASVARPKNV